jgi:WD40 repeat protein
LLQVSDLRSGKIVSLGKVAARTLAFAPRGDLLAVGGSDGSIRFWSNEGKTERERLHGHEGAVTALVFLPDGKKIVSGSSDRSVRRWEVPAEK